MFRLLIKELFYPLTAALIIFPIMELIHPGIVLAYINYNYILLLWLVNGIIMVVMDKQKNAG